MIVFEEIHYKLFTPINYKPSKPNKRFYFTINNTKYQSYLLLHTDVK